MAHHDSSRRIDALGEQDARRVAERSSRRRDDNSSIEPSPEPAATADRIDNDDERLIGLVIRIISGSCRLPARTMPRDPRAATGRGPPLFWAHRSCRS
jgi:hypothetical protein